MKGNLLILFLFLSIIVASSCEWLGRSAGEVYESKIVGNIRNFDDSVVILEEWKINEISKVGEAQVINGAFVLNTNLNDGSMYLLKLGGTKVTLIADSDSIYIEGTSPEYKDLKIVGSKGSNEILTFSQKIDKLNAEMMDDRYVIDSLDKANVADSSKVCYRNRYAQNEMELANVIKNFADTTTYFQAALYSIRKLDPSAEVDYFERFSDNITKRFPENNAAKAFSSTMKKTLKQFAHTGISVGSEAPDFTLRDLENRATNLSEFKGSYVLLNFWASWCPPCKHENKTLVQLKDSVQYKNFKIVGVSIDKDMQKLKASIERENLDWFHLNDPNEWESSILSIYGINKIPTNYLIDPTGKVIAKNVFGNELLKLVSELLSQDSNQELAQ